MTKTQINKETHQGRKTRPKTTKIGGSKVVKMVVVSKSAAGQGKEVRVRVLNGSV